MNLIASTIVASGSKLPVGDAGLTAVLGYAVVFVGLIALMIVISIVGKVMVAKSAKPVAPAVAAAPATPAAKKVAPGTAGDFMLHDVDPKTAAMVMAIIADKLGKPLNELRFKSIKEVK